MNYNTTHQQLSGSNTSAAFGRVNKAYVSTTADAACRQSNRKNVSPGADTKKFREGVIIGCSVRAGQPYLRAFLKRCGHVSHLTTSPGSGEKYYCTTETTKVQFTTEASMQGLSRYQHNTTLRVLESEKVQANNRSLLSDNSSKAEATEGERSFEKGFL